MGGGVTIQPERGDRYLCRGGVSSRVITRGKNNSVRISSWLCDMEGYVTNGASAVWGCYLSGLQLSVGLGVGVVCQPL